MGNWRTVHVTGACKPEDVQRLRAFLAVDYMDERWGCLHNGGICSLPNWAAETIDAVGNLGERGYEPQDVADTLQRIVNEVAPSLRARIDCGGDHESLECVATVLTDEDGTVGVLDPMTDTIPGIPQGQIDSALLGYLR